MIIGFGNNTVSSLAADITASQTTIQVMPGEGAKFAKLLSSDYVNTSNPLKVYAKITLTDAKETVFEVCHLTAVNNDMLTVVRGQEGTTAKGWALNDVVANFATRGSENQFVQIEQLQSGNYTSGVAGGSANALTIELPATYFINSSTDWALRTPIVVYPTQNNTGASTLQLVMGGRVLGTFPLYKGNKAQLVANDILKDVGLVCLMDKTKTFFNVANPGAIYAGLGTAAFKDVVTSMIDATAGRVPVVGWMGLGGLTPEVGTDNVTCFYYGAVGAPTNPLKDRGFAFVNLAVSGSYRCRLALDYTNGAPRIFYQNILNNTYNPYIEFYTTVNKPTAADVEALPIGGGTLNGNLTVRNQIQVGGIGNGVLNIGDTDSGLRSSVDGQVDLYANGLMKGYWNTTILSFTGQIIPTNYANFDARYQAKGNYTPAGEAYTKGESDGRYIQNIRASGTEEYIDIPYPGQATIPAGAFPTTFVGTTKSTGSGISFHISRIYYRRAQKYIGGAWVNI